MYSNDTAIAINRALADALVLAAKRHERAREIGGNDLWAQDIAKYRAAMAEVYGASAKHLDNLEQIGRDSASG